MIPWILCGLLLVSYWPLWRSAQRHALATAGAALGDIGAERDELRVQVERAREEAGEARDQKSRYFDKISGIEKEMTGWKNLYREQAIGHGNAQALMMNVIEHQQKLLRAKGVRFDVPEVLRALREEFQATHELPSKDAEALMVLAEKKQPALGAG